MIHRGQSTDSQTATIRACYEVQDINLGKRIRDVIAAILNDAGGEHVINKRA